MAAAALEASPTAIPKRDTEIRGRVMCAEENCDGAPSHDTNYCHEHYRAIIDRIRETWDTASQAKRQRGLDIAHDVWTSQSSVSLKPSDGVIYAQSRMWISPVEENFRTRYIPGFIEPPKELPVVATDPNVIPGLSQAERARRLAVAVHAADGPLSVQEAAKAAGTRVPTISLIATYARAQKWLAPKGKKGYLPGPVVPSNEEQED
jgi:hypothetical protein